MFEICYCVQLALQTDKYDNLQLVTDKKLIAKRYITPITGHFIIDFVTCIPFEFLIPEDTATVYTPDSSENVHPFSAVKVLRLFRLLRLTKILRFFSLFRYFRQFLVQEVVVFLQLIKITFTLLLFSHFIACLWFYVGRIQEPSWIDNEDLPDDLRESGNGMLKYSYAWYWAIVTLLCYVLFVILHISHFRPKIHKTGSPLVMVTLLQRTQQNVLSPQ